MRRTNICKRKSILKKDTEPSIKTPSEKDIFVSGTGWDGLIMTWVELNGMEISSRTKSKTFGLWKDAFLRGEEDRERILLVVNKLVGKVLKMGEIQNEGFGKSRTEETENSDGDDKEWGKK